VIDLPVYRAEDWPEPVAFGSAGVARVLGGDGSEDVVVGSREVHHGDGRRTLNVRSCRSSDDGRTAAWQRIAVDGQRAPSRWTKVQIPVDGRPQTFQMATLGQTWVAVATLDGVTVSITARHVNVEGLRVVEIPGAPTPTIPPFVPRREPRAGVLPERFDSADGQPRVELTYRHRRVITGTVGRRPAEIVADLAGRSGSARGRLGGAAVAARWVIAADVVTLTARLDTTDASLTGRFVHEPGSLFEYAEVTGTVGTWPVAGRIERVDGGESTSTVYAGGTVGETTFALWAAQGGDLRRATVRGTVGDRPVSLTASQEPGPHLSFTGNYAGPDVILLLIVGGLAWFS